MNQIDPLVRLPGMGMRVMVETEEGSILFAKRVYADKPFKWSGDWPGWWWIDDSSALIRSPIKWWTEVVATGATP